MRYRNQESTSTLCVPTQVNEPLCSSALRKTLILELMLALLHLLELKVAFMTCFPKALVKICKIAVVSMQGSLFVFVKDF